MHRSVTFSEIFSSTFSDDLNKYGDSFDPNVKTKFIAKIGIGLVEFIVSSIFLCYGIIFSECVNLQDCTVDHGLWTTVLYISSWYIAGPWSKHTCEYFESNKYNIFRYSICAATICLFAGFFLPGQILSYGIFGGIFSNFISVQLKFIATERYNFDLKTVEANIQVARALNLLLMPHFTLVLTSYYNMYQVKVIFAAFLLNVIPATLIINPPKIKERTLETTRYQTLPAFSSQIREMMEFTNSGVHLSEPSTPDSSSEEEAKEEIFINSISDDDLVYNINAVNEQLLQPMQLTPSNVQSYYSKVGVSILPGIPEETEDDEIRGGIDIINSRRISKISMRLEEINQLSKREAEDNNNSKNWKSFTSSGFGMKDKQNNFDTLNVNSLESLKETATKNSKEHYNFTEPNFHPDQNANTEHNTMVESINVNDIVSNKKLEEPERIENIEYIHRYKEKKPRFLKELRTIKSSYCCGCSPYRKFIWRRRYRTVVDFFIDNLFKPFLVSFKDLHYYPALISKVVINITTLMCFTLIPHMALAKNKGFQPEDATFLLSYIAFAWCLFLVLLPLVINFSKEKFRATYIIGLVLIGTCMTLIPQKVSNDIITISCLLYGFGYGIISYTENIVHRSFIGARKWESIQGTLETTTGFFVILTYYIIYHYKFDLSFLILIALISYYLCALLWIVAPILKDILSFFHKYYCRRGRQQIVT